MDTNSKWRTSKPRLGAIVAGGGIIAFALIQAPSTASAAGDEDQFAHLPPTLQVNAIVRDFRAKEDQGGHPDFQAYAGSTTVGIVGDTLDDDGKPYAIDRRGQKIYEEYTDSEGRNINPALFDEARGDREGQLGAGSATNGVYSEDSFAQWYRDVPGVNASTLIPLTLVREPGTNKYVFDSATDQPYADNDGFFPIDGELFGDYSDTGHNFHFTTEIRTDFVFQRGVGQVFKFTGDDDVWVYIDGRLVIDLGGLHSKSEQFLELDRLDWLRDGRVYSLHMFHAERRTTQSNFRVETTLQLRRVQMPSVSSIYD